MDTASGVAAPANHFSTTSLFMQEMHHRISNSLQLVSGILQLQAHRSDHPEVRRVLGEAVDQIAVIASTHRRLHGEDLTGQIDAAHYLKDLVETLQASILDRANGRSIELDMPMPFRLAGEILGCTGLIVNELVTNALKYGEGNVLIRIRRVAECAEIIVEDKGEGFPRDFTPFYNGGFGMRLLAALAAEGQRSVIIGRSVPFGRIAVKIAA